MKNILTYCLVSILCIGCATHSYDTVPAGYTGPLSKLRDSSYIESKTKGQFFVATKIDGNEIDNSVWATIRKTQGQGFRLVPVVIDRQIPSKPMKITLLAQHITGAPIHSLFAKLYPKVEGEVAFIPDPNTDYVVKGIMSSEDSKIWIETESGTRVTDVIVSK